MGSSVNIPAAELFTQIRRELAEGRQVVLRVKGRSMTPFLEDGTDSAVLSPLKREVAVGDIVLAEVGPGHYVLHRIYALDGEVVTLMGDGNLRGQEHCRKGNLVAAVDSFVRPGGEEVSLRTPGALRRAALWRRLRPLRRLLLWLWNESRPKVRAAYHEVKTDAEVERAFRCCRSYRVGQLNWPAEFPYRPDVRLKLFHDGENLFVRFQVREQGTAALETCDGKDVYMDSCVEFFLAPQREEDGLYYNFEWNTLGTLCYSCRSGRSDATLAPAEINAMVRTIVRYTGPDGTERIFGPASLFGDDVPKRQAFAEEKGDNRWTLTARIPAAALFRHPLSAAPGRLPGLNPFRRHTPHSPADVLFGKKMRMNAYKCGDGLSVPHYVTLAPIRTASPDYHRPEFFIPLRLE